MAFRGYSRLSAAQIEQKPEPKIGQNRKNHKPHRVPQPKTASTFHENRKPDAKNEKSANRNDHQNRKTEVFYNKNRKTDLKNSQNHKTAKPKIPMPPSFMVNEILTSVTWSCSCMIKAGYKSHHQNKL